MERAEFKERKRRLLTWILVVGLLVYFGRVTLVSVYAAPVTIMLDYDYGADEGGVIVSTEYTESISVEAGDTAVKGVILPTEVKKDGYIFKDWYIGVSSGYYDAQSGTLSWDSSEWGSLEEGQPITFTSIPLTAQWRPENKISIVYEIWPDYSDAGQVSADAVTQFRESQTAGPVTLTLPSVEILNEQFIFTGWEDNTSGDIMQPGATVEYEYPEAETDEVGAEDTYTFIALFTEAQFVEVVFDAGNGLDTGIITETYYQKSLDEQSTTITLPEAPEYENHTFLGWCEVDMSADMPVYGSTYDAGAQITLAFDETKTFVGQWEWAIGSGSVVLEKGIPYVFAAGNNGITIEGDSTVYVGGGTFYVKTEGAYTFTTIATQ